MGRGFKSLLRYQLPRAAAFTFDTDFLKTVSLSSQAIAA